MRPALCLMAAAFLTAAPARAGEVVEVKIDQLAYAPAKITAHVGDTVEWKNGDFVAHTATAAGGAFDVMISGGRDPPPSPQGGRQLPFLLPLPSEHEGRIDGHVRRRAVALLTLTRRPRGVQADKGRHPRGTAAPACGRA